MEDLVDVEHIALIAQIATGVATLAVALFLANQLRLQRNDSVRESSLRMMSDMTGLVVDSQIMNAEFADIYLRGCEDYESLDKIETHRFNMFLIMYFNQTSSLWAHESSKADPRKSLHNMLQTGPGVLSWWQSVGINLLNDNFVSYVHRELFIDGELRESI